MVKNESKQEWIHPYISIARGTKSSLGACLMYDHVFFLKAIVLLHELKQFRWMVAQFKGEVDSSFETIMAKLKA